MDHVFLKKWLQSPDYQSGVDFYLLHGDNQSLKTLFQTGPSAFTKTKLQSEMARLAEVPLLQPKPMVVQDFVPQPDWLQKKAEERVLLIKEQQFLKSQLIHFKTDEERKVAAFRILDLVDEITSIERAQNNFKTHGMVPVEELPEVDFDYPSWSDIRLCRYLFQALPSKKTRAKKDPEKLAEVLQLEKKLLEELNKREK